MSDPDEMSRALEALASSLRSVADELRARRGSSDALASLRRAQVELAAAKRLLASMDGS